MDSLGTEKDKERVDVIATINRKNEKEHKQLKLSYEK
jgi:hypothetical protein